MKKILFACDLDNTLIHSGYRDGDVCIERIAGKENSFINEKALKKLEGMGDRFLIVPITTRSIRQYKRIDKLGAVGESIAIVANGAVKLTGCLEDGTWARSVASELERFNSELVRLERSGFRRVDDAFVYRCYSSNRDALSDAEFWEKYTFLQVFVSGRKIYLFPEFLSKGNALKKLKDTLGVELVIAAGDSIIDVSMLEVADIAFCKEGIYESVANDNKYLFSDEVDLLEKIEALIG